MSTINIPWHKNKRPFHEVCHGVYGRKIIVSNRKSITSPKEAIEELNKAIPVHNQNRREIDYMYHYVAGDQPALYRTKDVRPEINNKIVENHALEINRFFTAQNYGEPIQYTCVSDNEDLSKEIDKLNNYMKLRSKDYHDVVIADFRRNNAK